MNLLNELDNFIDEDEREEFELIVNFSRKVMEKQRKNVFDDEVYAEVAKMFGNEYLSNKIDSVIDTLGVENKIQ